jgi:hypothetical protein
VRHFEDWSTVATELPDHRSGPYRLNHKAVDHLERTYWGLDGIDDCLVSGTLTYLTEGSPFDHRGESYEPRIEWMVDDPVRQRVMELYAQAAEGRVLVGGLGLGLLQHELAKNPRVTALFTIEQSQDVANLVEVPGTVFLGDFWEWAMGDFQFHTAIADLWDAHAAPDVPRLFADVATQAAAVRQANPEAKLILHGFPMLSDYDPLKTPSLA